MSDPKIQPNTKITEVQHIQDGERHYLYFIFETGATYSVDFSPEAFSLATVLDVARGDLFKAMGVRLADE